MVKGLLAFLGGVLVAVCVMTYLDRSMGVWLNEAEWDLG